MSSPDFHQQCLREIVDGIRNLGLQTTSGKPLSSDLVQVRRQPFVRKGDGTLEVHRGITVHPEPEQENPGTNRSEDIGYGCGVTMFMPPDLAAGELGVVMEWRRLIRRRFINQRLKTVTVQNGHHCICTVEHGDFAKDFDDHLHEISTLLIRVWARETRS